jgi:hypothetical protein
MMREGGQELGERERVDQLREGVLFLAKAYLKLERRLVLE